MQKSKLSILDLTQLALLSALIVLMGFTPLGMVPIIPGALNATTLHIPVIIGAILFGHKKGAFLGGVFGLVSLIKNTIAPGAMSFLFSPVAPVIPFGPEKIPGNASGNFFSVLICFIPRILVGLIAGLVYQFVYKKSSSKVIGCIVTAIVATITNTLFVLLGMFVFFHNYNGMDWAMGIMVAYGTGETILAAVLAPAICKPLSHILGKKKNENK